MTELVAVPWADFLPALEQWCRSTASLLRGELDAPGADEAGVAAPPPLLVTPAGELPVALAPRVRAAVAELDRVEALGAARRAALLRAHRYAA